jgi:transglutaminase-like putative cysteine protease
MTEDRDQIDPANLAETAILDISDEGIARLATELLRSNPRTLNFLRAAHLSLVSNLQPVYSVNEEQKASLTLRRGRGSCSQRMAVLEAIARSAKVATRVHAFAVKGRFWYPRFKWTRPFFPGSILLVWPQFYVEGKWLDFDEIHASMGELATTTKAGFTNTGESLFEAVQNKPVDFLGKTCGLTCYSAERDLSKFLLNNYGLFNTRDEVFGRFDSFQHTLRGRAFELIFGDRKSS